MNSKSGQNRALTKSKYETSKIVNKQDDSLPLYKKIEEMISTGKKDTGRLHHILSTLKENKFLYKSDKQYLEDCIPNSFDSENKLHFMSKHNLPSGRFDNLKSDPVVSVNYIQTPDSSVDVDMKKHSESDLSTVMHSIELISNKIEDLRKEYENGTSNLEHRDQTLTSHIHSLNARFEDSKLMYEKSGTTIQNEIQSLKSEVSSLKTALSSENNNLKNNSFSELTITKNDAIKLGTPEYTSSMISFGEIIKTKIDSTQSHLNSLTLEVDKIFLHSDSLNTQLLSTKSQLESVKTEYLEKESSAKKQIEQLTQTMKSQDTQLLSTKSQLESVKTEYLEKESSAKKQIEQINDEMKLVKSSISLQTNESKSLKLDPSLSNLVVDEDQLKTLKEEYAEKLSQKKEIDEYVENQLPAVTTQIKQLNEEYAKVSSELAKAKSELNT